MALPPIIQIFRNVCIFVRLHASSGLKFSTGKQKKNEHCTKCMEGRGHCLVSPVISQDKQGVKQSRH